MARSFRAEKDTESMEVLMSEVLEIRAVESEWFEGVVDTFFDDVDCLLH